MANNFYQINNEILKLNSYNKKDLALIQFNHYLCRKENLQRNKGELARGLFKLSYKVIEADTGLNRRSIREYIKWFEERNIIRFIEKSKSKGTPSIYAYTSVYDEKSEPNFEPNFEPSLSSNFNRFDSMGEPNSEPNSEPSKKEKEKENIKSIKEKEYKKELHYKSEGYKYSDMINSYTKNPYMVRALEKYIDMRLKLQDRDNKPFTKRAFTMNLSQVNSNRCNDEDKLKKIYTSIDANSKSIVLTLDNFNDQTGFDKFIDSIRNDIKKANTQNVKAKRENLI